MAKIMKGINTIHRCQTIYRSEALDGDLLAHHHLFVFAICSKPGRSQDELARSLCLNKSTVTRALGALEANGYVRREANADDKRQTLVYPTEKMTATLPKVKAIAAEWNTLISCGISESELEVFKSVLSRMEENARAAVEALEE